MLFSELLDLLLDDEDEDDEDDEEDDEDELDVDLESCLISLGAAALESSASCRTGAGGERDTSSNKCTTVV